MGAGSSEGSLDASNLLKPALARKDFSLIGATTFSEYQKFIQKDGAIVRRFSEVKIQEPSVEDSILILSGLKKIYENYHNIFITKDAIISAVKLSDRYITDRKLPDKAVDILDIASAKAKILNYKKPEKLKEIEKDLLRLKVKLSKSIKENKTKEDIFELEKEIESLKEEERNLKTF
jgi:ATP-dependent Clp protease ATP-binding subunit ClpA